MSVLARLLERTFKLEQRASQHTLNLTIGHTETPPIGRNHNSPSVSELPWRRSDSERKSLQAGATRHSASSIHFQVVLHAGVSLSPISLWRNKVGKKRRGGDARRMGVKGGAWPAASHPHTQRENILLATLESLLSASLPISQLSCRCKIQCIIIATQ